MTDNNFLFKVCHEDGREWTNEEAENYLIENSSFLLNFWTFLVDDKGRVYALDKCGQAEDLNSAEFKVIWNKKIFSKALANEAKA